MPRIKKTKIQRVKPPSPVKAPSVKAARASVSQSFGEGLASVGYAIAKKESDAAKSRRGRLPDGMKQVSSVARRVIKSELNPGNLDKTQGELIRNNWSRIWSELEKSNPGIYNKGTEGKYYNAYTKNEDLEPILTESRVNWANEEINKRGGSLAKIPLNLGEFKKKVTRGGKVVKEEGVEQRFTDSFGTAASFQNLLRGEVPGYQVKAEDIASKLPSSYFDDKSLNARKVYVSTLANKVKVGGPDGMSRSAALVSLRENLRLGKLSKEQYDEAASEMDDSQLTHMKNTDARIESDQRNTQRKHDPVYNQFGKGAERMDAIHLANAANAARTEIDDGSSTVGVTVNQLQYIANTEKDISSITKVRLRKLTEELYERKNEAIYGVSEKRPEGVPFLSYTGDENKLPQEAGAVGEEFSDYLYMELAKVTPGWASMTAENKQSAVRHSLSKVGYPITKSVGQWVDRNYHKFSDPNVLASLASAIANKDENTVNSIMGISPAPSNYVEKNDEEKGIRQNWMNRRMNDINDLIKGE